jgi:hypothetical protein
LVQFGFPCEAPKNVLCLQLSSESLQFNQKTKAKRADNVFNTMTEFVPKTTESQVQETFPPGGQLVDVSCEIVLKSGQAASTKV